MNRKEKLQFIILRGAVAIFLALLMAAILIFLSVDEPSWGERLNATTKAMENLLIRPFVNARGAISIKNITDILAGMTPIIFTGLATCVMFSANLFNLGAEGGIMLGAFVASLVAIYVPMPAGIHMVAAVLAGSLATGAMMLIPGVLKAKLDVSEMVNSLMLNYVIMYFIKFLMNTYFADKSKGSLQTMNFLPTSAVPELISNGSKLTAGFLIAIFFVIITAIFMKKTRWGYSIRMIGLNQDFAKYSGIRVASVMVLAQVLGGILAGMGGGLEVLGRDTAFAWSSLPGYGWTGITIACIAGNNPVLVPFAAFFMSYLSKGCNLMASNSGVASQLMDIIQAVIFIFFAAEHFLSGYKQRMVVKSVKKTAELQDAEQQGGNL